MNKNAYKFILILNSRLNFFFSLFVKVESVNDYCTNIVFKLTLLLEKLLTTVETGIIVYIMRSEKTNGGTLTLYS